MKIQRPIVSRGTNGEKLETWETVAARNVELREEPRASGSERFHANYQEIAIVIYQIVLRWERRYKGITPLWRLVAENDVIYQIEAVNNVMDRNREFRLRVTSEF